MWFHTRGLFLILWPNTRRLFLILCLNTRRRSNSKGGLCEAQLRCLSLLFKVTFSMPSLKKWEVHISWIAHTRFSSWPVYSHFHHRPAPLCECNDIQKQGEPRWKQKSLNSPPKKRLSRYRRREIMSSMRPNKYCMYLVFAMPSPVSHMADWTRQRCSGLFRLYNNVS